MEPGLPADPLSPDAAGPSARARGAARAGLYVHVPFCAARCAYCDFSSGRISSAALERYLGGLEREAELRSAGAAGLRFSSVFFGGGTPSALPPGHFRRAWNVLRSRFEIERDAEVTIEANPESVRDGLLETWAACGVNRLSLGVQSLHDDELKMLGRIHDASRPAQAVERARAHGFHRLSLDLMFAFPGHGATRWEETLEAALALSPEHLSAYCFIPEHGTPLGDRVLRGALALPDDDEQAGLYARLEAVAASAGYACYETSNFARPDAEARHNLVYWLRRPYVGLGPSAHGLVGGERYANRWTLAEWAGALEEGRSPEAERECPDEAQVAREILMLGLRLSCGVRPEDHAPEAWEGLRRRYGNAWARGLASGRLEPSGGGVRIPAAHRFVADDIIAWVDDAADRGAFDRLSRASVSCEACPT